jgi:3-methylcrotonyl-CoA carboxylase alpha subunit
MEFRYEHQGRLVVVTLERAGDGYSANINGRTLPVSALRLVEGQLLFELDGQRQRAWVAAEGARRWVALDGRAWQPLALDVPRAAGRRARGQAGAHEALAAQMPGVVRRVLVAAGQPVERGQALVLFEAMKMEIRVSAPFDGLVEQVLVSEGQPVERGQTLVELLSQPAQ